MIQLTYLKVPEAGDRGSVFCPAVSGNFETLNDHTHDGLTSRKIESHSLAKGLVAISADSWIIDEGGDYMHEVTLPTGYEYDKCVKKFVISSGAHLGREIHPTVIKTAINKFIVYVMTNTFAVNVVIA
jgi:hypothetical protein